MKFKFNMLTITMELNMLIISFLNFSLIKSFFSRRQTGKILFLFLCWLNMSPYGFILEPKSYHLSVCDSVCPNKLFIVIGQNFLWAPQNCLVNIITCFKERIFHRNPLVKTEFQIKLCPKRCFQCKSKMNMKIWVKCEKIQFFLKY